MFSADRIPDQLDQKLLNSIKSLEPDISDADLDEITKSETTIDGWTIISKMLEPLIETMKSLSESQNNSSKYCVVGNQFANTQLLLKSHEAEVCVLIQDTKSKEYFLVVKTKRGNYDIYEIKIDSKTNQILSQQPLYDTMSKFATNNDFLNFVIDIRQSGITQTSFSEMPVVDLKSSYDIRQERLDKSVRDQLEEILTKVITAEQRTFNGEDSIPQIYYQSIVDEKIADRDSNLSKLSIELEDQKKCLQDLNSDLPLLQAAAQNNEFKLKNTEQSVINAEIEIEKLETELSTLESDEEIIHSVASEEPDYLRNWLIETKFHASLDVMLQTGHYHGLKISPKLIKIRRPVVSGMMGAMKSMNAQATTNPEGDFELDLRRIPGIFFDNVIVLEHGKNKVVLEITESNINALETYKIEYGNEVKDESGKPGVNLICSTGTVTFYKFGEPITNNFTVKKPVIVFRDFNTLSSVSVKVTFDGDFKVIYPEPFYSQTNTIKWDVEVINNLIMIQNESYPYLFWDGSANNLSVLFFDKGFCVKKQEIIGFLKEKCRLFGFDNSITTDFITFWSPYMMKNEYCMVKWLSDQECDKIAKLEIQADQKIQITRMYMMFKPVTKQIIIESQEITEFIDSDSPKIFDWGGFEL